MPEYLSRPEAAAYISSKGLVIKRGTLGKFASIGGGPRYRKFGARAVYTTSDLDQWIAAKLTEPRKSTTDATES